MTEYYRSTSDLGDEIIQIPALRRPTLPELQKESHWIKKIQEDASPECEVIFDLGTFLKKGEGLISGDEYTRRRSSLDGLFGYQQFRWLVDHQDEHPRFKALLGKIYLDGPGIIVVRVDGSEHFACLRQNGERWYLSWRWTDCDLGQNGRVARSRK